LKPLNEPIDQATRRPPDPQEIIQLILDRGAIGQDELGPQAGPFVQPQGQFDQVAQAAPRHRALFGKDFDGYFRRQRLKAGGQQVAALLGHPGRDRGFQKNPDVATLEAGVFQIHRQILRGPEIQQPAGRLVNLAYNGQPEPLVGDGLAQGKFGQVQVEGDKVHRVVHPHRIDPGGQVAQDMIFGRFGSQGLFDRRIAIFAGGADPLAGVNPFPSGEEGGESRQMVQLRQELGRARTGRGRLLITLQEIQVFHQAVEFRITGIFQSLPIDLAGLFVLLGLFQHPAPFPIRVRTAGVPFDQLGPDLGGPAPLTLIQIDFGQPGIRTLVFRIVPDGQVKLQDHLVSQTHFLQQVGPGEMEAGVGDGFGVAGAGQGGGLVGLIAEEEVSYSIKVNGHSFVPFGSNKLRTTPSNFPAPSYAFWASSKRGSPIGSNPSSVSKEIAQPNFRARLSRSTISCIFPGFFPFSILLFIESLLEWIARPGPAALPAFS
jgi:hypothetical protein